MTVTEVTAARTAICGNFDEFEQWDWLQCSLKPEGSEMSMGVASFECDPKGLTGLIFVLS